MENNSPRAQSAHCSSHLHYAALQPRARFATACPPGARARALTHTHTYAHEFAPAEARGGCCWRGGVVVVVRETRRRLFHAAWLSIQDWVFSCFLSLISFPALFLFSDSPSQPRAHPGAWSSLARGNDGGDGGWGGSAPSRCHPQIAARGAQRLPALLRTRAQKEQGKHPAFQGEALGAPPSRALQDFPRP